ncbi:MAG TPA: glutamate-5-semialdehyde dehydrogenase [Terriglobales bacterium]
MNSSVRETAESCKRASRTLAVSSSERRSAAIRAAAELIEQNRSSLLAANAVDLDAANQMLASGEINAATFERLRLTDKKLAEMTRSMLAVAELPDPIGRVLQRTELDADLVLEKITCPLGVLAIIFEARPDAVTQISALGLKSANAVILKAGREVERTAHALVEIIRRALTRCGLPEDAVTLVAGRESIQQLLGMSDIVDMVIPRGSKQLVEFVQANTRIPVLGHAEGVCHIYVDAAADPDMALAIIDDSKTDYPAACNAAETVLVHEKIAETFLPRLAEHLSPKHVKVRGCEQTRAILADQPVEAVAQSEWQTEYSDLVLAVRVVKSMDDAIVHIHTHGSLHTETIVTQDTSAAERFLAEVDAAGVFHNASTRFADGYRYGFGAEVGISTSKLHARGPVGLEGLTTYKYVLRGTGQLAGSYQGPNAVPFTHKKLPID